VLHGIAVDQVVQRRRLGADRCGRRLCRHFGGDLLEMELHRLAVADREHEGGTGAAFGTDRAEQIGRLRALIMKGARA